MPRDVTRFQPIEALRTLASHQVAYVVIGGLAAALHGSPANTNDTDICPEGSPENLDRLAAALREMDARIRTDAEPDGLPLACDATFLARMKMVNVDTKYGWFDISFEPGGFPEGYSSLVPHAVRFPVEGFEVLVASLRDVIASKEAANRPKDHATLPYLYALEDEIAAQERENRT